MSKGVGLAVYDHNGVVVLDSTKHVWNVAGVFTYTGGNADVTFLMPAGLRYLPGEVVLVPSGRTAGSVASMTLNMDADPPQLRVWGGERESICYVFVK